MSPARSAARWRRERHRDGQGRAGLAALPPSDVPAARGVWEFNYRGSLEFLQQARAQQRARELLVEDGWRYFVHGWSQVVADVFAIPMPRETVQELADIGADVRG